MLRIKMSIIDLNGKDEFGPLLSAIAPCKSYVHGTNRLCSTHGLTPPARISQVRRALSWRAQSAALFLPRSVLLPCFCPTHRAGELARHRGLPPRGATEALPHGIPRPHGAPPSGQRQRAPRLAHLCRLGSSSDWSRSAFVCRPGLGGRVGADRLCLRFHHPRSVSGPFPLSTLSTPPRRDQAAYPPRPARQYSDLYSSHSGPRAQRQCSRSTAARTWRLLRLRSGLPGFCPP